ncbi:MAG: AarF/UbiB family protein, partial [Firmicutes bacterium]|nr:AarF/UbiB family protein [Bacillota bacterium]
KQYHMVRLMQDLVTMLRDEMDFNVEANNTALARKNSKNNEEVIVPEPILDLVHSNVLVLQELNGVKITDRIAIEQQGIDPHSVATHFVEAMYEQVFIHGFFHADPHPGNIHVDAQGRLLFLDWGLVGVFTPHMRTKSVQLVLGLTRGDSQEVLEALLTLGVVPVRIDRDAVLRDVDRLRRRYYDTSLKDFSLGQALTEVFLLAQRHQISIPVEYTLLAKAAVLSDGVVRLLDPDISLVEVGKPFAMKLMMQRINPASWGPDALTQMQDWAGILMKFPEQVSDALQTAIDGHLVMQVEDPNIDKTLERWEQLINRLSVTVLLAALVIGSSLVVSQDRLDEYLHLPITEYLFFTVAGFALWMVIQNLRRRK